MNRELLEKPFASEQIKQRKGTFGNVLDYVEGHAVIQRLNNAFEANWSFEITKYEVFEDKDEVIVLGKLTAENVVKMQFGSSYITKAKETGEIVSIVDDLKAAATDCLKKCASLLGVGLHLYNGDNSLHDRDKGTESEKNNPGERNSNQGGNGGNGRLSSKQFNFILKLAQEKSITRSELNKSCIEVYGVAPDFLSRSDASSLISELLN